MIRRFRWTPLYLLAWAPYIAVYQLTNRWHLITPTTLDFSWLDNRIPFVPGLLPIYVAYIPFYFLSVARSEDDRAANGIFYGTHFQLLLSLPFFVLMPVRMPRELFYGPETFGLADAFWRWFDAPTNCFPSLHASNCLLLMHANWRRPRRLAWTLAGAAIVASTVLVKQHYVVDLFGGVAVYAATRWFLARLEITGLDLSAGGTEPATRAEDPRLSRASTPAP